MPNDENVAKVFLSYERQDEVKVERLYHMLEGAGYQPWMDKHSILPGERWRDAIRKAVKSSDFFLAIISRNSVNKRGEIQREIKYALDRYDEMLESDIYVIPVRLDEIEIPERLAEIQWVDLFDRDGWRRLKKAIESRGFPGIDKPATPAKERWSTVSDIRLPILDLVTPTYILDNTYHFLDWNAAFDELVVKPTGIKRGEHALEFIRRLANCQDVIERSKEVFGKGKDPIVDIELLHLDTRDEEYGMILFQKIATQITDEYGTPMAWCVNLNVLVAEQLQKMWAVLQKRLEYEVNWSRYAVSYDKLLLPFDDYNDLVGLIVGMVGDAQHCIDLGAGTGNATLRLLEMDHTREVWALENNETMLGYLRSKIRQRAEAADYLERLTIVKEDVLRMDDLNADYFDAATLVNVLYAVEDPQGCLRQIHRILRPGGVLVLSTPHQGTDVDALFARMREVLKRKGLLGELKTNLEAAEKAHRKMDQLINRDSKEDIRRYIEDAGFEIEDEQRDWRDSEYVGAVVVVRARKKL